MSFDFGCPGDHRPWPRDVQVGRVVCTTNVKPGSPAAVGGLSPGDVILYVDGVCMIDGGTEVRVTWLDLTWLDGLDFI